MTVEAAVKHVTIDANGNANMNSGLNVNNTNANTEKQRNGRNINANGNVNIIGRKKHSKMKKKVNFKAEKCQFCKLKDKCKSITNNKKQITSK